MSGLYQPDGNAYPNALDSIKLLSQRDLAVRVPISFVPVAGISVSAACSLADVYDTTIFAKCISNLIATGFRRLTLDIYWDETRSVWSFCPVQLGSISPASSTSTIATATRASSAHLGSATLGARDVGGPAPSIRHIDEPTLGVQVLEWPTPIVLARQTAAMNTTSNAITSSSATSLPSAALVRIGPYACSSTVNLDLFLNILVAHLDLTENNLNASTTYLDLKIHAALTDDLATRAPSKLPQGSSSLQALVSLNTSDYLYTPDNLRQQRADLNASGSWFSAPENVIPDAAYFVVAQQGSVYETPDGWPSDSFIEFTKAKRLLVSFGNISAEMQQYDAAADAGTIFSPGYIEESHAHQLTSSGSLSSGCFFNAATNQISAVNNSWAVAEIQNTDAHIAAQGSTSLSTCGYTPLLNQTLNNVTAASSPDAYHQFVMGTVWSWDVDQPNDRPDSSMNYHCAVLNATSGRWQVESCGSSHFCACRVNNGPYNWRISTSPQPYDRVDRVCEQNTTFTVARTALESEYLLDTWRTTRASSSISDELLFLNFNDLDVATCWVVGQNATCPYQKSNNNNANMTITVPTVAAVIVFVLAISTIFVKCAANRQNTKRRRRRGNDDLGEYEGVPA